MNGKDNLYFMCIGAQKSGTTWLYHQLYDHPQVTLPPLKEIHYFDELQRGVKTNFIARLFDSHWMNKRWRLINTYLLKKILKLNISEAKWFFNYLYGKRDMSWYKTLFNVSTGKFSGDITPDYAALDIEQIKSIHKAFPNLKLIFLMRNPIERKWSHIKMVLGEKQNRKFSDVPPQEYLEACRTWADELGQYSKTIDNWTEVFGSENIFTGFYDELCEDPVDLYERILGYLKLDIVIDETKLKKVVYGGAKDKIPAEALSILTEQKRPEILSIKNQFANTPKSWLDYL